MRKLLAAPLVMLLLLAVPAATLHAEPPKLEVQQVEPKPKKDAAPEPPAPTPPKAPTVTMPATLNTPAGRLARLPIVFDGDDFQYTAPAALDVFREYDPDASKIMLRLIAYEAGVYEITAVTCRGGKLSPFAKCVVFVGTAPGPGPGPGPQPPPPSPAPIPAPGLRVLIVYDATDTKLPEAQQEILFGQKMRDLLNKKCVTPKDWNIWPSTAAVDTAPKLWQDAFKRDRKSLPWLIVSNGKAGFEGPLPATVEEASALISKYAE